MPGDPNIPSEKEMLRRLENLTDEQLANISPPLPPPPQDPAAPDGPGPGDGGGGGRDALSDDDGSTAQIVAALEKVYEVLERIDTLIRDLPVEIADELGANVG